MKDILGAVITFALGVGISALDFLISKYFLEKNPDKFATTSVIKQLINVAFLVGVYMVSGYIHIGLIYLLVGAVLGVTLPMLIFTRKLLKLNEALRRTPESKEGETDG